MKTAGDNTRRTQQDERILELRTALGQYPTGVAIVTTAVKNSPAVGMTINSFASVSLTPALISWCIDHGAASYEAFVNATGFTISILEAGQADIATRFATRGVDKFKDIELELMNAPVIPGACAWFKCETFTAIPLGDHTMLIGKIMDFSRNSASPLVFGGGSFRQLAPHTEPFSRIAA